MLRNLKFGLLISLGLYFLITLITYIVANGIDLRLIKMWGFGLSLLLFLGSFPFHKTAYHGRVANTNYTSHIPPDDHLQHKIQADYESTKKREPVNIQGVFVWTAIMTLLITILLGVLF